MNFNSRKPSSAGALASSELLTFFSFHTFWLYYNQPGAFFFLVMVILMSSVYVALKKLIFNVLIYFVWLN